MSPTGKTSPTVVRRGAGPAPRGGFTLIEVLVALVILATGVVAVLRVFETSAVALAESRNRAWSALLIGQKLSEVEAFIDANPDTLPPAAGGRFAGSYDRFLWRIEVDEPPPGFDAPAAECDDGRLAAVTGTIWRDGGGATYSAATLVRPRSEEDSP